MARSIAEDGIMQYDESHDFESPGGKIVRCVTYLRHNAGVERQISAPD